MIRTEKRARSVELNMAPMVDMIFLLIIFFLTATTFSEKEREQDVLLPSNSLPGSLSRSLDNHLIINVLEQGGIRVAGQTLELAQLFEFVKERRSRSRQALKVQVRADKRTAYGNVARVLEAVERAGVQKPYIVTKLVELGG